MNRNIVLGYTASGARVSVQIKLEPILAGMAAPRTTVHDIAHQEIPTEGLLRLSITGEVWEPRAREPYSAGQCTEDLLDITTPAAPWTLAEITELHDLWQRWHLNDMRTGCIHQTKLVYESTQYGRRVDLDATTKANWCPANYRYGSAWLYERLPTEVVERIHIFQRRLRP